MSMRSPAVSADAQEPEPVVVPPEAELAELGERLRAAREARGLTLNQVHADLRISRINLANMEAGAFDRVSSVSALREGHVRTYSQYLGVEAEPILSAIRGEEGDDEPEKHEPLYPPVPRRHPLAYVMTGISLIILIVLIMAWDRLSTFKSYLPDNRPAATGFEAPSATVPLGSLIRMKPQSEFSE